MPKAYQLKDANGKEFEFDVQDIMDMVTSPQIPLEDGETRKEISLRIIDHIGNPLTLGQITDSAGSSDPIVALDVKFEATHSGRNLNYTNYHSDSMEKDAATFMVPFKKPLIKNHDMYEEPLGRVVDFQFGPSILNDARDCIAVTWRVTDSDAIPKFLDGRYGTLSIGATANHVKCEVCGNDIVKDGQFKKFCGHWRGETYNGVTAYWTSRDLVYKEGSIVNAPADHWAQVIEIKAYTQSQLDAISDSSKANAQDESNEAEDKEKTSGVSTIADNENSASIIDSLLADNTKANSSTESNDNSDTASSTTDGEEKKEGEEGSNEEENEGEGDDDEQEDGEKSNELVEIKTQLDAALVKITGLETDLATKTADLDKATATIVDLEASKKISDDQANLFKNQAVKLAIKLKDDLVESIVKKMIDKNEITAEEADSTKIALKSNTTKELEDKFSTLSKTSTQEIASVTNPGLVNNDEKHVIKDEDEPGNKKTTEIAEKTKKSEDVLNKVLSKFGFN